MNILYGVQGTGNGHISRARAIGEELNSAGFKVDFLFSGREKDAYFAMEQFGDYQTRSGLSFVTKKGKVRYIESAVANNPIILHQEINELDLKSYDLVLNDYEPVSAWAAQKQGVPSIGISHQNAFLYDIPKVKFGMLDHMLINHFAPTDYQLGLHWYHYDKPILPPIVPGHALEHDPMKSLSYTHRILVYLPFETLPDIQAFLETQPDYEFICFHPQIKSESKENNIEYRPLSVEKFHQELVTSGGVVCNGGFELPSEALALGKKLLIKPLQGQFEQLSNAATLESLGLGVTMQHLEPEQLSIWLKDNYAESTKYPNVAKEIVSWLDKGDWGNSESLFNSLWGQVKFPSYIEI
jgi:uncharacterized protein (TIGR00661 family)